MSDLATSLHISAAMESWRPPPRLRLSEWADEHYHIPEGDPGQGRWKTRSYQRGIMDAITDPLVEQVSVIKSARVGYTRIIGAAMGYHIHQDPCPILMVQPTDQDAEDYSKEDLEPIIDACPELRRLIAGGRKKRTRSVVGSAGGKSNTIKLKLFPGGLLHLVGANSPRGFRRVSRRVIIFDETDGYPESAGDEGDQIELGINRSLEYWNRKIIAGSTPTIEGRSRIKRLFEDGDRRRYHVPCPHCGHMDYLAFNAEGGRGHCMRWIRKDGLDAHFVCSGCSGKIEHKHKADILDRGEWRAEGEFHGHASFHIWAAYSYSPNATWAHIAKEFLKASKAGPMKLRTFINTWLGETWKDQGDAPDWERIYERREQYEIGVVPMGVLFITCGVDVQKDRIEWELVGWGRGGESWSIDYGIEMGAPAEGEVWKKLDDLLTKKWAHASGVEMSIAVMAVDSGDQTQIVYNWCRKHPMSRVIAVKGASTGQLVGHPSPVDLSSGGQTIKGGYKYWPVNVNMAKEELYSLLRIKKPKDGEGFPAGYCHFPQYGEEFFLQITAEQCIPKRKKGVTVYEWSIIGARRNERLDCRNYARAAASVYGMDRFKAGDWRKLEEMTAQPVQDNPAPKPKPAAAADEKKPGWVPRKPGGWIDRRR